MISAMDKKEAIKLIESKPWDFKNLSVELKNE